MGTGSTELTTSTECPDPHLSPFNKGTSNPSEAKSRSF